MDLGSVTTIVARALLMTFLVLHIGCILFYILLWYTVSWSSTWVPVWNCCLMILSFDCVVNDSLPPVSGLLSSFQGNAMTVNIKGTFVPVSAESVSGCASRWLNLVNWMIGWLIMCLCRCTCSETTICWSWNLAFSCNSIQGWCWYIIYFLPVHSDIITDWEINSLQGSWQQWEAPTIGNVVLKVVTLLVIC